MILDCGLPGCQGVMTPVPGAEQALICSNCQAMAFDLLNLPRLIADMRDADDGTGEGLVTLTPAGEIFLEAVANSTGRTVEALINDVLRSAMADPDR